MMTNVIAEGPLDQISTDPYKEAGVDTERGDALAEWLADKSTTSFLHPRGLGKLTSGIGGFAGSFEVNFAGMKRPQLVASTDGVGTKLLLGIHSDHIDHLGQDLVAMCANDLYTVGATPLFFLDYFATGVLSDEQFKRVLTSIKESCKTCGMALMGGETAEMPGLYQKGHFDLAGFVVGVVDESLRLGAHRTQPGDVLVSWQSSGFHSNGFSLIRRWLENHPNVKTQDLISKLMTPTKLYPQVVTMAQRFGGSLRAMANVTGGGISGNLPRVVADNLMCVIRKDDLPTPQWMTEFIASCGATFEQVEPVFNLGCGMIAIVSKDSSKDFLEESEALGLKPRAIGYLDSHSGPSSVRYI